MVELAGLIYLLLIRLVRVAELAAPYTILHMEQMETLKKLEEKMKERESKSEIWNIPEFVKTEITDMIKELKKNVECPICYEELTADKIKFSGCGHKYCETCLSKINECAICRRKIYRKD